MKKLILFGGITLLLFNSFAVLLISSYSVFNWIAVDFSIISSVVLLSFIARSHLSSGFKIGLTLFFLITAALKFSCALFAPQNIQDNPFLLCAVGILVIEVLSVLSASAIRKR